MNNRILKYFIKLIPLIFLVWMLGSCNKDDKVSEPVVEIFNPEFQQQFILPDTIEIRFSVNHDKPVEYIRISIVNYNMIPISNQEFLYPENNIFDGTMNFYLDALPESGSVPPYYIHIAVSDVSQIYHTYLKIGLSNREMKYEGCFLITRSGIDEININYINDQYVQKFITEISGNYTDSDISHNSNMLYLLTDIPDKARAIDCENGELIWTKDPQLPYPEFNRALVEKNIVFFSTAIGRIIGLTIEDGIQVFTTPVLPDSIPVNICLTSDYLIADTRLRDAVSYVWVSYYKQTGSRYLLFPTNYETVAMFGLESENRIIVFCNKDSNGHIITFNAKYNIVENNVIANNGDIQQSCKIDNNNFLFSTDNMIFHFNLQSQSHVKIAETENIIIGIKFDNINNRLFVAHPYKVEIFSYPDLNSITTIETSSLLKGVELKYGY